MLPGGGVPSCHWPQGRIRFPLGSLSRVRVRVSAVFFFGATLERLTLVLALTLTRFPIQKSWARGMMTHFEDKIK